MQQRKIPLSDPPLEEAQWAVDKKKISKQFNTVAVTLSQCVQMSFKCRCQKIQLLSLLRKKMLTNLQSRRLLIQLGDVCPCFNQYKVNHRVITSMFTMNFHSLMWYSLHVHCTEFILTTCSCKLGNLSC